MNEKNIEENSMNDMNIEKTFVSVVIGTIVLIFIFGGVFVPIIEEMTQEEVVIGGINEGAVGYDLSYYTPDMDSVPEYTLTVTIDGGNVTVTGMGTKTADDMAIMLSDSQALLVKNGKMYYIDGNVTEEVVSIELTLNQTELNDNTYEWVYFPEIDGKFASFPNGFQYNISNEIVGAGTFAGISLISKDTEITNDNPYGFTAEIQTDGEITTGVIYEVVE